MNRKTKQALAILLAMILLLSGLAGCSKREPATEEAPFYRDEDAYAEPAMPAEAEEAYDLSTSASEISKENGSQDTTKNSLAEKIIYTGSLYIETTEFDKAIESIESLLKEFDGFIEQSSVNGDSHQNADGTSSLVHRNASYTLRVPCNRFNEFFKRSGTIGNVLSSNTSADNITSMFTDSEARKDSLKVQEERLLAMMEKTDDIESLIELERRVSEVRYDIDSIERQLINWQRSVDYSTVSLTLREVEIYTPVTPVTLTFGQKLANAFADGWNGFKDFAKRFILWFARSLPTLIILAIIAVGIIHIIRSIKRRKKTKVQKAVPYAKIAPSSPLAHNNTEQAKAEQATADQTAD